MTSAIAGSKAFLAVADPAALLNCLDSARDTASTVTECEESELATRSQFGMLTSCRCRPKSIPRPAEGRVANREQFENQRFTRNLFDLVTRVNCK